MNGLLYRGLFTEDRPNGTGEFTNTKTVLSKGKDRTVTEQVSKRSSLSKPPQSAQFIRSNLPLKYQLSQHSSQKIVRPSKMAKLNTSREKNELEKIEKNSFEKRLRSTER